MLREIFPESPAERIKDFIWEDDRRCSHTSKKEDRGTEEEQIDICSEIDRGSVFHFVF